MLGFLFPQRSGCQLCDVSSQTTEIHGLVLNVNVPFPRISACMIDINLTRLSYTSADKDSEQLAS